MTDNLTVSRGVFLGSSGDDAAVGVAVNSDNIIIAAGNVNGSGTLYRLSPQGGSSLLSTTDLGGTVSDLAVVEEGGQRDRIVVVGSFGIKVYDPTGTTVAWSHPGSFEQVAVANDGRVVTLAADNTLSLWSNTGTLLDTSSVISGVPEDIAVSRNGTQLYVTGYRQETGNLQIPYIRAFTIGNNQIPDTEAWDSWDFDTAAVQNANLGADSRGVQITIAQDGNLYFLGRTDGGNNVFQREPNAIGTAEAGIVNIDTYTNFSNTGSGSFTFYAQIDPSNGDVIKGQYLLTRLSAGGGNSYSPGAITVDGEGNVYVGGTAAASLPDRANQQINGNPVAGYSGGDVALFSASIDLGTRNFWTPFTTNSGTSGSNGSVVGVATGEGFQVLLATAQQPEELFTENGATPLGGDDIYLAVVDITPPSVVQLTPADNLTDVPLASNLQIQFTEGVQRGTGSVTIHRASDNSIVETIAITSGQVTLSNDTLIINPTNDLAASTNYYVQITAGAIEDLAGNDFAGIADTSTWNLTTTAGAFVVSNLIITGIIDGPLSGGTPKAIELYALSDIADLSIYGLEAATNGSPSTGVEFTLSGSATAGDYIYVASETPNFNTFFGFNPTFVNGVANINGDDTIVLFENGTIVDVFGEIGVDGTGRPWEHLDGWAYRNNGADPTSTFDVSEWTFSGVDALDDDSTNINSTATPPWPIGTFTTDDVTPTSLDLSTYVRIGRYDLPEPTRTANPPAGSELALEVSAITYNPNTDTLFVLGDEGTSIVEINKQGQLVSSMTLTSGDFADPEGLTYVSGNQFVLVEERLRQASLFTYTANTTLSRGGVQTVDLGTDVGNIGLEGVSYDPQTSSYIFVKETSPQGVFQTTIDFGAGTASNGSATTENSINLFDPALLSLTDIADVFALANSSFVSGNVANNLFILSQEDGKVLEVDRSGNILSTLTITADPGNPLTVTNHGFEGVTLDNNGLLYLTSESGGGDGDHPQVWVYAPSSYTFSNAAPVAVSVANGVTTLLENVDTTSAIKLGNIIVSDDSLGTNTLTVSDTTNFEIVGNELFLKAGTVLDFGTQSTYTVTIAVDDATLGSNPDATTTFTLDLQDTAGTSDLIISEVAPWSSGNSSLGADWFEVTNTGANAIDITGWVIDDDSANFASGSALSGVTSIAAGQSVVFVDGDAATITAFIDLWFGGIAPTGFTIGTYDGPGLGTGGDGVNLFNAAGSIVTGTSFGTSPGASPFATFDNAAGTPSVSNLSAVGTNGAFSVIDAEAGVILTGSPGTIAGTPTLTTTIGIVATGATASENGPTAGQFTLLRTGDTTNALDVTYSISSGSGNASNGTDYTAINATTATIPAGESQVTIAITPIDDGDVETTESVTITLTDTVDYNIQSGVETATVTIQDNDTALPNFNLQVTEIWPGNSTGSNLTADWFEITNTGTEAWVSGVAPALYYDDDSQAPAEADLISGLTQLDPGEAAIVVIGNEANAQTFRTVWESVINLTGVEVGYTDGAGLGANGDGVSLFVGLPVTGSVPVDFETYPTGSTGRSYNSNLAAFSVAGQNGAVATAVNNLGQAAIGSPGNGSPITRINAIQGSGDASPLVGQTVTLQAIVVGDFQAGDGDTSRNLNGFYVQEEDGDADGNALTSEGLFIFDGSSPSVAVNVGDKVQITGTLSEYFGETQLTPTTVTVISSNNTLPTAANITLPAAATTLGQNGNVQPDLEAFEGMRVNFTDTLTISEMFNLDRFNEIKLVQGDRPVQFTQNNDPSAAGLTAHLQAVGARTITYDDGLSTQNQLIGNLDGFGPTFSTASDIRMGDTITGLSGVLSYQWAGNSTSGSTWRVRSTQNGENTFTKVNDRPATPEDVGGSLKVTGFNVLNYFKTIDLSGVNTAIGQDPRGADTTAEFDRQTDKLVTALLGIDADVLGLVELENDFLAGSSGNAIEFLVNELNAIAAAGTYAWIDPGTQFVGTDAIAVGLIYKPSAVNPVGDMAILNTAAFLDPNNTSQNRNRPAVAQTFEDIATGGTFTAVVNHLKSKGAEGASGADLDQNDGQGAWNDTRTKAAQALVDWLNTNPTGENDSDYLLLGDFNAYAQEDPVKVLEAAGYVNLASNLSGRTATSYVFDGQVGTLDYAFASASLFSQVTGATEWGINSDEADALDYNLDFGRDPAIADLTSPVRTSDHDPVIVGLNLVNETNETIVQITALNANKAEGNSGSTPFTFTVTRSGDLSSAMSVDYTVEGAELSAVVDGNLSASTDDFAPGFPLTGTIAFATGEASKVFTVEVAGDTIPEVEGDFPSQDVFIVSLSNPSGGASLDEAFATGFIINDDEPTQRPITSATPEDDELIPQVGSFSGVNSLVFTGAGNDRVDIPAGQANLGFSLGFNRIFTGSDIDEIFVADGDRAFGGSGNDILDASDASGYRLSGGAGDDQFFLGVGGRALGGDGNETFTVGEDGGNLLSGGAGSDLFNILTDNPALFTTPNTIVDFTVGTDTLGILNQGVNFGFNDLTLEGNEIKVGSNTIAILVGVQTSTLTTNDFTFS